MADKKTVRIWDWAVGAALAALAALVYFLSMATYVYPGESAHLQVVWRGLDVASSTPYPLMAIFARPLGCGNAIAPLLGIAAVALLYLCTLVFSRRCVFGEEADFSAVPVSRIAAAATALVFLFTPAVRSAATHLEPRLFDAVWALVVVAVLLGYAGARRRLWAYLGVALIGVLVALKILNVIIALVAITLVTMDLSTHARRKMYYSVTCRKCGAHFPLDGEELEQLKADLAAKAEAEAAAKAEQEEEPEEPEEATVE